LNALQETCEALSGWLTMLVLVSSVPASRLKTSNLRGTVEPFLTVLTTSFMSTG
jgi:hypothetical protein